MAVSAQTVTHPLRLSFARMPDITKRVSDTTIRYPHSCLFLIRAAAPGRGAGGVWPERQLRSGGLVRE